MILLCPPSISPLSLSLGLSRSPHLHLSPFPPLPPSRQEKKTHVKTEAKQEFSQGKYRSISRTAVEEGGGVLGWQQAPLSSEPGVALGSGVGGDGVGDTPHFH